MFKPTEKIIESVLWMLMYESNVMMLIYFQLQQHLILNGSVYLRHEC